jgi:hypothetical protein
MRAHPNGALSIDISRAHLDPDAGLSTSTLALGEPLVIAIPTTIKLQCSGLDTKAVSSFISAIKVANLTTS